MKKEKNERVLSLDEIEEEVDRLISEIITRMEEIRRYSDITNVSKIVREIKRDLSIQQRQERDIQEYKNGEEARLERLDSPGSVEPFIGNQSATIGQRIQGIRAEHYETQKRPTKAPNRLPRPQIPFWDDKIIKDAKLQLKKIVGILNPEAMENLNLTRREIPDSKANIYSAVISNNSSERIAIVEMISSIGEMTKKLDQYRVNKKKEYKVEKRKLKRNIKSSEKKVRRFIKKGSKEHRMAVGEDPILLPALLYNPYLARKGYHKFIPDTKPVEWSSFKGREDDTEMDDPFGPKEDRTISGIYPRLEIRGNESEYSRVPPLYTMEVRKTFISADENVEAQDSIGIYTNIKSARKIAELLGGSIDLLLKDDFKAIREHYNSGKLFFERSDFESIYQKSLGYQVDNQEINYNPNSDIYNEFIKQDYAVMGEEAKKTNYNKTIEACSLIGKQGNSFMLRTGNRYRRNAGSYTQEGVYHVIGESKNRRDQMESSLLIGNLKYGDYYYHHPEIAAIVASSLKRNHLNHTLRVRARGRGKNRHFRAFAGGQEIQDQNVATI